MKGFFPFFIPDIEISGVRFLYLIIDPLSGPARFSFLPLLGGVGRGSINGQMRDPTLILP
jgi:hypothetical protein